MRIFECSCGSEGVSLDTLDNTHLLMSWWQHGHGFHEGGFRHRLGYIWDIIRKGHPYADSIVFLREEALQFAKEITGLAESLEKL